MPVARAIVPEVTAAAVRAQSLPCDAGFLAWPAAGRSTQVRDIAGLAEEVAGSALGWDPVRQRAEDALGRVLVGFPGGAPSGWRGAAP